MKEVRALGLAATILLAASCGEDRWLTIIYPDGGSLGRYELAGEYSDLETCRAAAVARLRALGAESSGDYECGLNCERDGAMDLWVCEETAD